MIIDPISATLAVATTGLGLIQGSAQQKAQQQDYLNQSAFNSANAAFARWQSGMSAKVNDLNNGYQYWQQTVQYNQSQAYVHSLRNFELAKELQQAEVVRDTRAAAGTDFALRSDALQQQVEEKAMQDAVALQQYRMQRLRSSSAVQAMATEGRSVDRLVNDYARQEGDYSTLQQISRGLMDRQYRRDQVASITRYLQQYNSQQFYQSQPYMDAIAPFAPLPTMIQPPPPSMTGGRPASYSGLGIATSLLSGANTYISTNAALSKYKGSNGSGRNTNTNGSGSGGGGGGG